MFRSIKEVFYPPYKPADLYSIFIATFIVLAIPITLLLLVISPPRALQADVDNVAVKIENLQEGATVESPQIVKIEASSENFSINSIELKVDGKQFGVIYNQVPTSKFSTSFELDPTKFRDGEKSLVALAQISNGSQKSSQPLKVNISNNDHQPPIVNIMGLTDGAYVNGNLKISLEVTDNTAISEVQVFLDGKLLKTFAQPSYSLSLSTENLNSGNHKITAKVIDLSGNVQEAESNFYVSTKAKF